MIYFFSRTRQIVLAVLVWGIQFPLYAITHHVENFRLDSTAAASDTAKHLDKGWGDSLLIESRFFTYRTVLDTNLSDDALPASFANGFSGASPIAASTGRNTFKVGYLAFGLPVHADPLTALPQPNSGPVANIVTRSIFFNSDTAIIDPKAYVIANKEGINPIAEPFFLNFAAAGNRFAAYWGPMQQAKPIRRTTHKDTVEGDILHGWGKNLQDLPATNPAAIDSAGGWGMVSATFIPATNGNKSVVAVDSKKGAGFAVKVRWEDFESDSSTAVLGPLRTLIPSDLAVAADSSGNSVVLWREVNAVYAIGYDNAHAQTLDTIKLLNSVFYSDVPYAHDVPPNHFYRPYAITSISPNNYIIVYSKTGIIYYQTLFVPPVALSAPTLGPPVVISNALEVSMYPDISINGGQAVIAWFQKTPFVNKFLLRGTIFKVIGNDIDITTNVFKQQRFTLDTISFAGQNLNWKPTHYLKSASVAIDDRGNVVAAYDNGYNAKISLISNTATYFDSATFQSRPFLIRNSTIPSYVFLNGVDSVKFSPFVSTDSLKVNLFLESAQDSLFTIGNTGFQAVPAEVTHSHNYFRYKVLLKSSVPDGHRTTPKIRSLDVNMNIKPLKPSIDSIKTGKIPIVAYNPASQYSLLPRKDSLRLVFSGFDLDNVGLNFRVSLGNQILKTVAGVKTSPGNFKGSMTFLPKDTLLNPLKLIVASVDDSGWMSETDTLTFNYKNISSTQNITVIKNRGLDVDRVFKPVGGGIDTILPINLSRVVSEIGDSVTLKVTYTDANDDSVTTQWKKNKDAFSIQKLANKDTLTFKIPIDTSLPLIDTVTVTVGDKDTTSIFKILLRPNRIPTIDSLAHTGYKKLDSSWVFGEFDNIKKFSADTGLIVPLGLPTLLESGLSDLDQPFGDLLQLRWNVWKKKFPTCTKGDLSCYQITDSIVGVSFTHKFTFSEEYLSLRVSDSAGAFIEHKVKLKYPVVDTGKNSANGLAATDVVLNSKINFILGASTQDTTVTAIIKSAGTMPLRIDSVKTLNNDQDWLRVVVSWKEGVNSTIKKVGLDSNTNENPIQAGNSIFLDPLFNSELNISFNFSSKSLTGDSILFDTLLIFTNDFIKDTIKIPFRMKYDDLPRIKLSVLGSESDGTDTSFNAGNLPRFMPARSKLIFAFTETIKITDTNAIKIYSYLDSLKNPKGYKPIKGDFDYLRKTNALSKTAAESDFLADTIIFTPNYEKAADSLRVKPAPGYFIYRDVIRISIRNFITDKAGNNLDLRLNRARQKVGAFDTTFSSKVDTGFFKVLKTEPVAEFKTWNPDLPMRIHFNRKLSQPPPIGIDTLTLLNLKALLGDSNRYLRVTSAFQGTKRFNFQYISLTDGDSTLVFKTKPRMPALDTVTVSVSGGLLDTSGLSLDGNGNKFPDWLYAPSDTADSFIFTFITRAQDFYVYPNPFRFSDVRHREKGSVTFKNINSLDGFIPGKEAVLRIHTINGDLVYNSHTDRIAKNFDPTLYTSIDWNLKNLGGNTVGTGVYIYTISSLNDKLLHKGKVAIVR